MNSIGSIHSTVSKTLDRECVRNTQDSQTIQFCSTTQRDGEYIVYVQLLVKVSTSLFDNEIGYGAQKMPHGSDR